MAKRNLPVKSIGIYKLIIPLKEPFVISLGAQYDAESIIVVIKANDYTDYTVSIREAKKMAADAAKYKQQGYPVIKIKLGESKHKDAERIHLIREAIGYEIPLRIDANQGWDLKTAIATLNELERYNIQYCEEPIPRWDFMRLRKLRKKSPI